MEFTINPTNPMSDYGPRENWPETRASERAHEIHDEAQARLRHEQFPALLLSIPSPQELDAIAKMEKDLMAKLDRANKIDRLKAELRLKAEELRASEEEQAFRDSPNKPLTNEELDVMLDKMNRDYMAAKQAEQGTETRAFPAKLNPHDE